MSVPPAGQPPHGPASPGQPSYDPKTLATLRTFFPWAIAVVVTSFVVAVSVLVLAPGDADAGRWVGAGVCVVLGGFTLWLMHKVRRSPQWAYVRDRKAAERAARRG